MSRPRRTTRSLPSFRDPSTSRVVRVIGVLVLWRFLPGTKGWSLEEIEHELG